jgi:outer membrane receptor protein involved in Fe transport
MKCRHLVASATAFLFVAALPYRTLLAQETGGEAANVFNPTDVEEVAKDTTELSLDELQSLDLEQLLKMNVGVGNLTKSNALTTPASVTTITEEDIRLTPARNIIDLLEVYVPGASFVIHSEGLHPGIRGIISDRNYKFLLLVNGKVMNQNAHGGVTTELEDWDLSDIAQIDVLRGPGSVTYGPGAIAGVISITTKNARKFTGTALHLIANFPYNTRGVAFETSFKNDLFEMYAYGSRVTSTGTFADTYQTDANNNHGFLYQTPAFPEKPVPYYGDFMGKPQYKAFVDVRFKKEWDLWIRYTNQGQWSGTTTGGNAAANDRFQTGAFFDPANMKTPYTPILGAPIANKGLGSQQIMATIQNEHRFSKILTLKPQISVGSLNFLRRVNDAKTFTLTDPLLLRNQLADPDSVRYYGQRFAESQVFARILANLQLHQKLRAALGAEYLYEHFGPAWGDAVGDFRMGDANNIISGTNSNSYGLTGTPQGVNPAANWVMSSGWGTSTISGLGEINFQPHRLVQLLLSGRIDKNTRSQTLISPRAALVSQITENNVIKLIAQRAQRMNTAEQLMYQQVTSEVVNPQLAAAGKPLLPSTAEPEVITGYEASFTTLPRQNLSFTVNGFYNDLSVIGFNTTLAASQRVGELKLAGAEFEAAYSSKRFRIGFNHSFVKQLSWHLGKNPDGSPVTQSGISYADFAQPTTDDKSIIIQGYGNDLANWANQSTKLFIHARFSTWLLLHIDSHVFWGEQGQKDALSALQYAADHPDPATATAMTPMRTAAIDNSVAAARAQGAYGVDWRLNASAHFLLSPQTSIGIYGQNLLSNGGAKRYGYDAGLVRAAPIRTIFVQEPLMVGANLTYTW